jgi:hypothetical protein
MQWNITHLKKEGNSDTPTMRMNPEDISLGKINLNLVTKDKSSVVPYVRYLE